MNVPRTITVAAAAVAVLVGFGPYLDSPFTSQSLSQFSTDQAPAFWFGRATVVLLVLAASATFRSLRVAAGLAVAAVGTAVAPVVVPALRGTEAQGWASFSPTPPQLPTIDATPRWGLGALMLLATFTVAVLMLALIRASHEPGRLRAILVGVVTLLAISAEVFIAVSYRNTAMVGTPRRYVDYLPVPTGPNLSGSSAWYGLASVVLVLAAVVITHTRRPFSAPPPS